MGAIDNQKEGKDHVNYVTKAAEGTDLRKDRFGTHHQTLWLLRQICRQALQEGLID